MTAMLRLSHHGNERFIAIICTPKFVLNRSRPAIATAIVDVFNLGDVFLVPKSTRNRRQTSTLGALLVA